MLLAEANTPVTDWIYTLVFMAVFVTTLMAGLWVVIARDVIRAGVSLFICLSGVAGIYFFLNAQFLAVVQIMVYVGGTTVLILFGVMLTNRAPVLTSRRATDRTLAGWLATVIVAAPLFVILVGRDLMEKKDVKTANGWFTMKEAAAQAPINTVALGDALLTSYILPFEIASLVLLVALVGSAYLARRREDESGIEGRLS
ncbi:MAG: NADH-quinone oxidoreductase subunit J [Planctomycetes bacterium]|nr:NADH-quinone oxidoreductase subunit J [Planctomycetota bacterium]